ncbi:MAG: DCC1-like thiol-disulfide oxidoreductase family protein [Cytophagales bacterium]|nr:DCC1-like thiol-disulfide oxidoreductase family protein [Bernardetiaceae bacterium]MDW8205913.1 DCC1-like thiol-disulfide oxidoreductase family protein [Cytophagales bacterium]
MHTWENTSLVLFDGICNLCNGLVDFLLSADRRQVLKFASLQSATGQQVLQHFGFDTSYFDTFIFYDKGKIYTRSRAALEVARKLGGIWQIAYLGILIPPCIRDWVYQQISAKRYQWFGKRNMCRMPTPELQARFL